MILQGDSAAGVRVRSLEKTYSSRRVLQGLDFSAESGECVAIVGPNGAGKTTFLRILATLSRPAGGEVLLGKYRLPGEARTARSLVGVVFHQPMLYGDLTARENLSFFAGLAGLHPSSARCRQVLEEVGLLARSDDPVRTFSRGMIQRLSLGRAILTDPPIYLLDEPYSSLDAAGSTILDGLLAAWAARGKTVVMASHDLAHAALVASRIDVLIGGRIALSLPQGAFPATEVPDRVAAFLQAERSS